MPKFEVGLQFHRQGGRGWKNGGANVNKYVSSQTTAIPGRIFPYEFCHELPLVGLSAVMLG